jgi:hypothetical protein
VDHQASTNPDLMHDLSSIPWPLPDNHFETEAEQFEAANQMAMWR